MAISKPACKNQANWASTTLNSAPAWIKSSITSKVGDSCKSRPSLLAKLADKVPQFRIGNFLFVRLCPGICAPPGQPLQQGRVRQLQQAGKRILFGLAESGIMPFEKVIEN